MLVGIKDQMLLTVPLLSLMDENFIYDIIKQNSRWCIHFYCEVMQYAIVSTLFYNFESQFGERFNSLSKSGSSPLAVCC